ncbi:uncharacterized protein [Haliotis asinina]|uniref:uncharacterized protein n=1 Tax=Haliotis asinina TaxID=109174 RepID=UPI0035318C7F
MASTQKYPQTASQGGGAKNIPASNSKRRRNLTRQIIHEPSSTNGKAKPTSAVTKVPKATDDVQARERARRDRSSLQGTGIHPAAPDDASTSSDAEATIMKCVATAMVMGAKTGAVKESGIITMKGLLATDKKSSECALPPKTKPRNMKMVVTAKVGGSREAVMKVDEINVNKATKAVTVTCDDNIVNDTDVADSSNVDNSDLKDEKEDEVMFFQCWSWYSTRPAAKCSIEDVNTALLTPEQHDGSAQNEQYVSSLLETLEGNQDGQALSIHSAEETANDWLQRDRDDGDSHDPSDMATVYQRKEENIKKWSTIMVADEYSDETGGSKRIDQRPNADPLTAVQNRRTDQENESENHSEVTGVIRTSNIPVKTVSTTNKPAVITKDQRLKTDVIKVNYEDANNVAKSKTDVPKKTTEIPTGAITELKGKASKNTTEDDHAMKRTNIPIKTGELNRTHTSDDITDTSMSTKEVTRMNHNILTVMDTTQIDILTGTRHESGNEHPISNVSKTVIYCENEKSCATGKTINMNQAEIRPRQEHVSKTREMTETCEMNIQETILINTNVSKEQGDRLNSGVKNVTSEMKIPETTPLPTNVSKRQDGRSKPREVKDADKMKSQEALESNTKVSKEIGNTKVTKVQDGRAYSEEKHSISKKKITETGRADSSLSKEQDAGSRGRVKNDSSPVVRPVSTGVSKSQGSSPKTEERKDGPIEKIQETESGNSKATKKMADTVISTVKGEDATAGEMRVTPKVVKPHEGACDPDVSRAKAGEMKHTTLTNIRKASLVTSYTSTEKGAMPEPAAKNGAPKEVKTPESHPSNTSVTTARGHNTISKVEAKPGERKGASKKNITDASLVPANVSKRYSKIPELAEDNDTHKVKTQGTPLVTSNVSNEQGDGNKAGENKIPTVVTGDVPKKQTGRSKPVEKKDAHTRKIQEAAKGNPMVSKDGGETKVSQVHGDRPNPAEKMKITGTSRHGTTGSKEKVVRSSAREKHEPPQVKIPEIRPVSTSVPKRQDGIPKSEVRKNAPIAKIKEAGPGKANVSNEKGDIKVSKVKGEGAKTEDIKATSMVKVPEAGASDNGVSRVIDGGVTGETKRVRKTNIVKTSLVTSNVSTEKDGIREPAEKDDTPKVKTSVTHIGNSSVALLRARGGTNMPKVRGDGVKPGETENNTEASLVSTNISKEHGKIPELGRGNTPLKDKSKEAPLVTTIVSKERSDNTKAGEKNIRSKIRITETSQVGTGVSQEHVVRSNVREKNESSPLKTQEKTPLPSSVFKEQDRMSKCGEKKDDPKAKIKEADSGNIKVSYIHGEQGENPEPVQKNTPLKKKSEGAHITGFSKVNWANPSEMKSVSMMKNQQADSGNINVTKEQGETKYSRVECDVSELAVSKHATKKNIPESGPGNTNVTKGQANTTYSRVGGVATKTGDLKDASKTNTPEFSLVTSNTSTPEGGIPELGHARKNITVPSLYTTHISSEKGGITEPVEKNVTPELKIPETRPGETGVNLLRDDNMISQMEGDGAKSAESKGAHIPSFDVITSDPEQAGRSKSGEKKDAHKLEMQEAFQNNTTGSKEQCDRSNYAKENGTSNMKIQERTPVPTSVSKEQGVRSKAGEKDVSPTAQISKMRLVSSGVSKIQDGRSKEKNDSWIVQTKEASSDNSKNAKEMGDTKVSKVTVEGDRTGGMKVTSKVKIPQEGASDTRVSRVIGDGAKLGVTKHTMKTNIPDASQVKSNISSEKGRIPGSAEENNTPKVKNPGNTSITAARGDHMISKVEGGRAEPGEKRDASKRNIPGTSLDTSAISNQQDGIPESVKMKTILAGKTTTEADHCSTEVPNEKGTTTVSKVKSDGPEHGETKTTSKEENNTRATISNSAEGNSQYFQAQECRSEMDERGILNAEDRNDSLKVQMQVEGTDNTKFSHFHDEILTSGTRDGAANLKTPETDLNKAQEAPNQGDRPDHSGLKDTTIRKTRAPETNYRQEQGGGYEHREGTDSTKFDVARIVRSTTPSGPRDARKFSPTVKIQITRSGNTKESKVKVAKSKLEGRKNALRLKSRGLGFTNAFQGHDKSTTLKSKRPPKVMIPHADAHKIKDSQNQSRRQGERKIKVCAGIKKCATSRALKGTRIRTVGERKPAKVINSENLSGSDPGFRAEWTNTSAILTSSRGPVFFNVKWEGDSTMKDIFSWRPVSRTVSKQSIGENESSSGGTKHEKVSHGDHYNCYCHPNCSCKFNEKCFCGKHAGH